ncbi:MAG: Histidine kinase, gyrase and HSP90-like ATPase, partial [Alphaproteobacteria bacterium]|nr:Histidine kinase, gyrase and HSP90-like ATPase [Alphaproteobacteria bacterium]
MAAKRTVKVNKAALAAVRDGEESLVVKADADKLFFIEMLVKDIELIPAVLDLVDNSVDGARAQVIAAASRISASDDDNDAVEIEVEDEDEDEPAAGSYDGRYVKVVASAESFEISDNCGGIDLDVARDYAFRFGRSDAYDGVPGSVGQFGVGMKRALFKLGRAFTVTSRTDTTSFLLDVDVDKWADEPGTAWTFELKTAESGLSAPEDGWTGTRIVVKRLHDTVQQDFANDLVLGQLREQLRLRHQGAIQAGMAISLNKEALKPLQPRLLSGPSFQPVNKTYVLDERGGPVVVKITAGIVETNRQREAGLDEGKAENFLDPGDAGWWLFCNDRLLLMRDRSVETGWGKGGGAAYHPQYRMFRGYVFLTAENTALLPWNTTKTGVDQDSRVWRQVQAEMRTALVEVQAVINRLKGEKEDAEDADDPADAPYSHALAGAVSTPL